ncbi:hypothetical protein GCM10023212_00750 [Luteolibacter yonseiensis]
MTAEATTSAGAADDEEAACGAFSAGTFGKGASGGGPSWAQMLPAARMEVKIFNFTLLGMPPPTASVKHGELLLEVLRGWVGNHGPHYENS